MISVCSVITALTFFILPAQTPLYDANLSTVVNLPAGYFVVQSDETAPDGFISVVYDDLTGYVKASSVVEVDYRPVNRFETSVTFRCDNDGQLVNLRRAPKRDAEIISVLPSDGTGHSYGTVSGDALIKNGGTEWYYVRYGEIRGYLYYAHISVDDTPPNVIEKEPEPQPEPEVPTDADPIEEPSDTPSIAVIILIVALCVPVPFIMFYLFRKPKNED